MELLLIATITVIVALFSGLAVLYGVDSRDGSDDPRRPAYPVSIS